MDIKGVLVLILIILILYVLIKYALDGPKIHTGIVSAQQTQVIQAKNIATTNSAARSNFTHSIWFYINDWNYNIEYYKPLLVRATRSSAKEKTNQSQLVPGTNAHEACPAMFFQPRNNVLEIYQTIESGQTQGAPSGNTVESAGFLASVCKVTNIPIQKWCQVLVLLWKNTISIWTESLLDM